MPPRVGAWAQCWPIGRAKRIAPAKGKALTGLAHAPFVLRVSKAEALIAVSSG
jgi:hypothetical protein